MSIAPIKKPCASCPWRKDASAGDIPNFDHRLAKGLARCCPDERGMGPEPDATMFACHQSRPGAEFACAGWLAKVGRAHVGVRLAVRAGRIGIDQLEPGPDWPELHDSYPEVLRKLGALVEDGA